VIALDVLLLIPQARLGRIRAQMRETLQSHFSSELGAAVRRIRDAIAPFSTFVEYVVPLCEQRFCRSATEI
jgi:hypothetical protein